MTLEFVAPFSEYRFMSRALVGCLAMCVGAIPVGVFMTLRRMSLTGDAMAHAILPGVAIAYLFSGLSLFGLTLGGMCAGLLVALAAGWVTRNTHIKEDTSLGAFYLISLALGVLIISVKKSNVDLFHVLFGNVLALDRDMLLLLGTICSSSLLLLALLYRPLVIECVDPQFLKMRSVFGAFSHFGFLFLMVINLVAGFHALGTLMAVGLMILPSAVSRLWVETLEAHLLLSLLLGFVGCYCGLLFSFYWDFPSGPAIVLCLGVFYVISLLVGKKGGYISKITQNKHYTG
ncbi:metal ABC transporter permease [Teredinibacter turnerae]|uniref:metal ABC transporter permease n=1 Tax=Teredinibacter turnerae TaxID=2426 RepID=UPI00036362C6|nr:metal ABC transporter permease [Teredinibacter turnerae]